MTSVEIIKAFEQMPKSQRLKTVKLINEKMADDLFEKLNKELPNIDMLESEIMKEVKAIRYGL